MRLVRSVFYNCANLKEQIGGLPVEDMSKVVILFRPKLLWYVFISKNIVLQNKSRYARKLMAFIIKSMRTLFGFLV